MELQCYTAACAESTVSRSVGCWYHAPMRGLHLLTRSKHTAGSTNPCRRKQKHVWPAVPASQA